MRRKEEGAYHQENDIHEMFLQQVWAPAQRKAHSELLQKGECRNQRPARHGREHNAQQHPHPERIDFP